MNEKFNKKAKVEQLTKVVLSHGEEKGLIVKDPLHACEHKVTFLKHSCISAAILRSFFYPLVYISTRNSVLDLLVFRKTEPNILSCIQGKFRHRFHFALFAL